MAKLAKKIGLLLLSILVVVSTVWGCFTVTAASNLLFEDTFSSGLSGWSKADVGKVSGGTYVLQGTANNTVAGKQSATKIGIVADVKVARITNSATKLPYGNGTASITFHGQSDNSAYYEFGLGVSQNGAAYAFLCLNRPNGESPILKKQSSKIPGAAGGVIQENKAYTLKVLLYEGKIHCYINDMLFCTADDNLKNGAIGVASWNAKSTFDHFAVYDLGEKEITSIAVLNAPAELTYGDDLGVQIQVNYSGFYGSEILTEDAAGLNITGYNGAGLKKMTATYGGKSASFTVNVLPAKGVTTLFDAGKFVASDWQITNNDYSNIGLSYDAQISGGKLHATMPKGIGFNSPLVTKVMVDKDFSTLQNYAITASGVITTDSTTSTKRFGAVDLYFAQNTNTLGYRVESNGTVTLYNGSTVLASGRADVALGKAFTAKIEMVANIATLAVNGESVLSYDCGPTKPLIGVRLLNGTLAVTAYKVQDLGKHSKWNAKSIQLVDAAGNPLQKVVTRGLNIKDLSMRVTYYDGAVVKMSVSEEMLRGYNPNSFDKQTVTVVYGNATAKFTYEYTKYLYKSSFDSNNLSALSMTNLARYEWSVKNGKLYATLDHVTKESKDISSLMTVQVGALKNVSVSADVAFLETNDYSMSTIALQVRKNGSYGYELAYNYRLVGGATMELVCRSEEGGTRSIANWVQAPIIEAMGVDIYDQSMEVNLRLEVIGRTVAVYLNNKLMGAYYDDSEYAELSKGSVITKIVNARATIDNLMVEEMADRQVKKIEVLGADNGIIQMYRGFELENGQYSLNVIYDDGASHQVPLQTKYLSQYADLPVGLNQVAVNYYGVQTSIKIQVSERPEYVADFEAKLKALDPKNLTLSDKTAVAELKSQFTTLSPWEVKSLSESLYKRYRDIIEAMDRLRMAEIEGMDLLYYNDFTTSGIDAKEWDTDYVSQKGEWFIRNGYMINEQNAYGVFGTSWAYLNPVYGDVTAFEADLCMAKDGAFASLVLNITEKGYYHARITNKYTDEDGYVTIMAQLYKCVGTTQYKLEEIYTELYGLDVQVGKYNAFRIGEVDGVISVFIDDVEVIRYDDSSADTVFYEGAVALRTCENDAQYDNLRVYGTAKERPTEQPKNIEPTYYDDDFEDEEIGKNPSHWIEDYDYANDKLLDDWKVYNKGGNKVLGTNSGRPSYTYLHGFEIDPQFTAKFMYTGSGKVGFLTRLYDEISWLAIGYDTQKSKWFLAATECTEQETTQVVWAETAEKLTAGAWYDVEIVLAGITATVKVNGKQVLQVAEVECNSFGRIGVFSDGASMYADDFHIKSVNGAYFQDEILEYNMTDGVAPNGNAMEMEYLGDGKIIALPGGTTRYLSTDYGATWENITNTDLYANNYSSGSPGYPTLLHLGENSWMMYQGGDFSVYVTHDGMKTWTQAGFVMDAKDDVDDMGRGAVTIHHVGSLTKIEWEGKTRIFMPLAVRRYANTNQIGHYTKVYYSDDLGRTWTLSQNDTRDLLPGYAEGKSSSIAEAKVIKCADGTLRLYQSRNDFGSVIYFESLDGGASWTGFGTVPYMQAPMGSYGIGEDPHNPGTYYMAWVNTNPDGYGNINPRIRLSLARTTDGKNWEFMCDLERTSVYNNNVNTYVRQILDPNILVTEDYVHIACGRSNVAVANNAHNNQIVRYIRVAKDKLTVKPWNDATISDSNFNDHLEIGNMPQTRFGLGDLFQTYGGTVKEVAINGNVTEYPFREYTIISDEPNMYKLGKYTVTLMNVNLHMVSYEIEVVPSYFLTWTIRGKGTVDPNPDAITRMAEGSSQTFTLKPDKGYKVDYVEINGERVKVSKNTFTISEISADADITVCFRKLTILDYLPWILGGLALVAGVVFGAILLIKKQKSKAAQEPEDISSHSAPPADEN